ncbi:V-set and immunoglobulin domain-containing protein 4 isoform X2 [Apodemus sylvaticus]|uniref:V-set and immunoglobulin domain-containing protein 4 isoform X2 n=1 Tax=Apodemus sylvaticus TaxID=10129 RepID=UPI0022443E4A|nr:V-set and immunoglobulin domain-containing protein 4 isoform X2 [Apodemus sylvaticus]
MEGRIEVASRRMGISLGLLFLCHLIVLTYGHPTLKTPESVTGTWKGDVKIQCLYDPLSGYRQVLVKWLVQRDSNPVTIFLRDSTGDHIQQAKYRGRLQVSQEVPGDVSLQLNTLQMDDRNHYTCEVTWQTPDGNQIMRDKIIELRVQKYPYNPPRISTEALTTMHSSLEALQCKASDPHSVFIATTIMRSTSDSTVNRTGKPNTERTITGPGLGPARVCCLVGASVSGSFQESRKEPANLCHNLHHLPLLHSSYHHTLYHVPPQDIPTRVCLWSEQGVFQGDKQLSRNHKGDYHCK